MEHKAVKMLMIDENQENLTALSALINNTFPTAVLFSATNEQNGIDIAINEEPNIILIDVLMSGMDEYELCRKLKENKELGDIPVVLITSIEKNNESRTQALTCGADAFLRRPIDEIELIAQIQAMIKINEAHTYKRYRFHSLFNHMSSGVAIYKVLNDGSSGKDYIVLDFNQAALQIEKKEKVEVVGKSLFDLRPNIDEYGLISVFQKVWKTGEPAIYPVKIYSDATFQNWYENRIFKLPGGEIVSIYDDVTDKMLIQNSLAESESTKTLLLEHLQVAIVIHNTDSSISYCNSLAEKLLGLSTRQMQGKHVSDMAWHFCDKFGKPLMTDAYPFSLVINNNIPLVDYEMGIVLEDKRSIRWLTVNGFMIRDNDGKVLKVLISFIDTTEKKNSILALMESEERYKYLFENSGVGIGYYTTDGLVISYNEKALENIGGKLEDYIGKSVYTLFSNQEAEIYFERIQKAIASNTPQVYEDYLLLNSNPRWFSSTFTRVAGASGQILGVQIASLDITERKNAEILLKASETKYSSYIDNSPYGVFVSNEKGQYLDVNPAATAITGYERERLLQMSIQDITALESITQAIQRFRQLQETHHLEAELQYIHANGSIRWWTVSAVKISENRYLGFSIDITEKKQAEEKEKLLTERLTLATSAAKLGIWDWDIVNNKLIWDDGMYRLYNTSRDNFTGAYEAWAYHIHPDDKAQTEQAIQDALDGKAEYAPEFRIIWSDGSVHFLQAAALTFHDTSGKPTRMVGINYDITSLRKAEAEVRENELRFRSFIEQSPIAIGIFNLEGFGIYANQKCIETLGLANTEEFAGKPAYNYFAPKFIEESKERTQRRLLGLPVPEEYESIAVHPDGSEFPVHLAIAPIHLPSGTVSIAFLSDITARKEVETAVKLEAERYHALIESTKDWIWVVDSEDHKLTLFNSSVASYFKRNHGVILRQGMIREEMLSENRRDLWNGFYKKAINEGAFTTEYQTDVEKLNFIVSLSPLIIDEKTVGVSVFAKDITSETHYKEELELSNLSLSKRMQQSLNAISKIGEIRDAYTAGHQKKVTELSCAIAREMGLPEETIINISFGALIHDIGKIYIASDILNKPGKITNLEYQILQTHVDQSYEIVKEIDFPPAVIEMIHQHHEHMDGSGYPQRLVGSQIITEARILAVADVVEAMTSHRPYRPALGIDKALAEIMQFRGEKYDIDVVDACLMLFREKGFEFTCLD